MLLDLRQHRVSHWAAGRHKVRENIGRGVRKPTVLGREFKTALGFGQHLKEKDRRKKEIVIPF